MLVWRRITAGWGGARHLFRKLFRHIRVCRSLILLWNLQWRNRIILLVLSSQLILLGLVSLDLRYRRRRRRRTGSTIQINRTFRSRAIVQVDGAFGGFASIVRDNRLLRRPCLTRHCFLIRRRCRWLSVISFFGVGLWWRSAVLSWLWND